MPARTRGAADGVAAASAGVRGRRRRSRPAPRWARRSAGQARHARVHHHDARREPREEQEAAAYAEPAMREDDEPHSENSNPELHRECSLIRVHDRLEVFLVAVRARFVDVAADGEQLVCILRLSGSDRAFALSTSSRDRFIHSSPSFARGTIISRLPDSASATAWLRAAVHSSLIWDGSRAVPRDR